MVDTRDDSAGARTDTRNDISAVASHPRAADKDTVPSLGPVAAESLHPTLPGVPPPQTLDGLEQTAASGGYRAGKDIPLTRGQLVGRYVIVDRLGAGGMGVVYRAFDPDLDRSVALKLVALTRHGATEERSRLLREAQAMARLSHPNVIPVFDVGVQDDAVFVAMELVDGVTLGDWVRAESPSSEAILAHFDQAGRGLAAAHAAGLVHRDFKPDNVMVGKDGRVRVLDFGLARGTSGSDDVDDEITAELRAVSGSRLSGRKSLDQSMTAAGALMGTPAYMSPEQHHGAPATAASDQFSFCVALWEALLGERPFEGDTMGALAINVSQGIRRDVPASHPAPDWVVVAMERGLSVEPGARFPTLAQLLDALAHDPRARRRRVALIASAATGILVAGGAAGAHLSDDGIATATTPSLSLCTGAADAFAPVWNDERRDALRDAFAATGLAYASAVWSNAAARLDGYASAWVQGHTATCRATRVTGEQSDALLDARMHCLSDARRDLDALLGALADADDTAVERAIDAIRDLPAPATCQTAPLQRPPTADPRWTDAVADADAVLANVRAQHELGHFAQARWILAPVLVSAEVIDDPALSARVLSWDADVQLSLGALKQGRQALQRGYEAATSADLVSLAASMASQLAYAHGYQDANHERGRLWLGLGRALVRREGVDEQRAVALDASEGAIEVAAGRYDQAKVAHGRALAYWEAHAPDSAEVARTLDDLGSIDVLLGDIDAAIAKHDRALTIRRRLYGDNHPRVALSERELGMSLSKANRDDEAIEPLRRALKIHRAARGETNTHVATCMDDLGRIERRRGNLDAALKHHQEALAIWEAVLGDPHPDVAVSLLGIGYTLVAAERPAEAVPVQRRALRMFEASVGAEHPYVIYAANALGMAQVSTGEYAEGEKALNQALALRGKVSVDPTLFGDTLFELGKAGWHLATSDKERTEALALAQQARDLFATQGERWTSQLATIDTWMAAPH